MSPSHPRTPRQVINFSKQKGKEIIANFDGGLITSDAGIFWIAELDKKLGITEKFGNPDFSQINLKAQSRDEK